MESIDLDRLEKIGTTLNNLSDAADRYSDGNTGEFTDEEYFEEIHDVDALPLEKEFRRIYSQNREAVREAIKELASRNNYAAIRLDLLADELDEEREE